MEERTKMTRQEHLENIRKWHAGMKAEVDCGEITDDISLGWFEDMDALIQEIDDLSALLSGINTRVVPGDRDSIDSLRKMYREYKVFKADVQVLKEENQKLWKMIEFAKPSMKRDFARCGTQGETPEKWAFKRWLAECDELRSKREKMSKLMGSPS